MFEQTNWQSHMVRLPKLVATSCTPPAQWLSKRMSQELRNSASGFALRQRKRLPITLSTLFQVLSTFCCGLTWDIFGMKLQVPVISSYSFKPLLQAVVDHALKTRNVELVSFTSAVSSRAKIAGSKRQQMGISCEYTMNILWNRWCSPDIPRKNIPDHGRSFIWKIQLFMNFSFWGCSIRDSCDCCRRWQ